MAKPARIAILKTSSWRLPVLIMAGFLLVACRGKPVAPATAPPPLASTLPAAASPSPRADPTATSIPATPTLPATATQPPPAVCSPFPGYTSAELLAAISNPFNPPPLGSDDPHQAVDLAVVESGMAMAGGPAHALLAGRVALVVRDRFPYGNAVLVETPLADLPSGVLPAPAIPTLAPTLPPHPALTCPAVDLAVGVSGNGPRSLYILYAHLESPADLSPDEPLACGDFLGTVGQSGNALNPHLHVEARVGPSGVRLPGLAHYETRAGPEEMGSYCLWRVSNRFQLIDPTRLLEAIP
jgi:murein DD-endopeptidase MepM/ murein hydrolase activator NlpD